MDLHFTHQAFPEKIETFFGLIKKKLTEIYLPTEEVKERGPMKEE